MSLGWKCKRAVFFIVAACLGSSAVVSPAAAQQSAGIAGVVRDSEGLPIPGVTVEAESPALIERTRTVFSDGEGRYQLVDLRPGTYVVTFSLAGFSTVRREGIVLNAGFTASVDVALSVGALEETITVTGAAPVVDTQSIRQQEVVNTSDLAALPSGNIGLQTLAVVTPGFATTQADVGGTRDTWSAQGAYTFYHGKAGTRAAFDGFRNQYFVATAVGVGYVTDQGVIEEMQLETSGMGAEAGSGSTNLNIIPKSGGNDLRAMVEGFFSNGDLQSSNIDDELRAFGITSSAEAGRIYRLGAQLGGPFVRDRVWFFGAIGYWGKRTFQPGAHFNALQGQSGHPVTSTLFYPGQPGTPFATADPTVAPRAADYDWYRNHSLRTTAQVTQNQRVSFFFDFQKSCRCTTGFTGANAIESQVGWDWTPAGVVQGTWTMPVSSRLLLEAGASWQTVNWVNFPQPGVTRDDRSILELATSYRYGAPLRYVAPRARTGRSAERFSLSYVTGTHNFKAGVSVEQAFNDEERTRNHPDGLNYDFLNGRPAQIQYQVLPLFQQERMWAELGVFAQDSWTITDRLTVTLGLRFDYVNMGWPASDQAAGPYTPARSVEKTTGAPEWTDINPRYGVAYDVFGNGRTAIRFSAGRYNGLTGSDYPRRLHPFARSVETAFRTWNDADLDFTPDCDLANFEPNGECGRISNQFFGQFRPDATLIDPNVSTDNRDYLWDYNVEVQHEVMRGLSVSFGYNYNYDGAFQVTDNLLVGPGDFDEFCVQLPADPRIPGGGGVEQCGYYDVKPQFFGRGQLLISDSDGYGDYERFWHGVTVSADGRLPHGITLGGGIDVGKNTTDACFTVDAPNIVNNIGNSNTTGPFCRTEVSWADNLDLRVRASIPVRSWFNVGLIFRNTPGAPINTTLALAATSPIVRFPNNPERNRLNTTTVVPLHAERAHFSDRFSQLDINIGRSIDVPRIGRLRASLDIFNALNANSVQSLIGAYGARYLRPTTVLDPRIMRITASLDF